MNTDDVLLASETARMQGGEASLLDTIGSGIANTPAAVAGATMAAATSFYNTGIQVVNLFGAQAEEAKTADWLGKVNSDWRKFYEAHEEGVELAGFIAGSILPGTMAVRGMQLAKSGKVFGTFGTAFGWAKNQEIKWLEKGLAEVAAEGGTIFSRINKAKYLSMGFGAADSVIDNAAFMIAGAATMHASPVFADESWKDIAWDTVQWSLAGGALTGFLRVLPTNRLFKDAGKLVDQTGAKYETIVRAEDSGFLGDKTMDLIDEFLKLPKEVLEADKELLFNYSLAGGTKKAVKLQTGNLYSQKLEATSKKAVETLQANLTNVVATDTTVGAAFSTHLVDIVAQGVKEGKDAATIRQALMNQLMGLKGMQSVGAAPTYFTKEVLYMHPEAVIHKGEAGIARFSQKRLTEDDLGYRIVGDPYSARTAVLGIDAIDRNAAIREGFDFIVSGPKGKIEVSPQSQIFKRITSDKEVNEVRQVYNTKMRTLLDDVVPTIADVATAERPLLPPMVTGVTSGKHLFQFTVTNFNPAADSVAVTARHLWATQLKKLENVTIHGDDFSVLSAIKEIPDIAGKDVRILIDGKETLLAGITDFPTWLLERKRDYAVKVLASINEARVAMQEAARTGAVVTPAMMKAAEEIDNRLLAYRLNTSVKWVQDMVNSKFDLAFANTAEANVKLSTYGARENIVMVYDSAVREQMMASGGDFATAQVAYEYRRTLARQAQLDSSTYVLGDHAAKFQDANDAGFRGKFDATGTGAGFLSASNANYGDIARMWSQDTGKITAQVAGLFKQKVATDLQAVAADVLTDPKAGAELAGILTRIRRSVRHLALLDDTVVDLDYYKAVQAARMKPTLQEQQAAMKDLTTSVSIKLSKPVADFMDMWQNTIHASQFDRRLSLLNAKGVTTTWQKEALYVPPIDTAKLQHFALVRQHVGRATGTNDTAMITARSEAELSKLISQVDRTKYEVVLKDGSERYHKALGDFELDRTMNNRFVDSDLQKAGVLGDFYPTLDGKVAVEQFLTYATKAEEQLVRDAVEMKFAPTFQELRWLDEANTAPARSVFSFLGKTKAKEISTPYADYIKTALNVSKQAEYTLWHDMNRFVDEVGTRAYRAAETAYKEARGNKITWTEANDIMDRMGIAGPFTEATFTASQIGRDRPILQQAVKMANSVITVAGLGLDVINSMINIISTPLLLGTEVQSIRSALKKGDPLAGKLRELMTVVDPASGVPIPSTTKLLGNAVGSIFTPEGKALAERFKSIGAITDILKQNQQMMADLAVVPNVSASVWAKKVADIAEKGTHVTGNKFAEESTRYVAAHVMMQITDPLVAASKMTVKEQNAFINIFVNRVQGNYTASQRPIAFQGTVGAAVSLFQTYQFNLLQQLFRHIENRDTRALAVMGGLQTAIFGLNGLPLFNAINTHLIGNAGINEGHNDAYTSVVRASRAVTGDDRIGNWLMYGGASAFPMFSKESPALYSRGDLNPRHVTILPTSPADVPAYSVSSRFLGNLMETGKNIAGGAGVVPSLLMGLEHNSLNRPLAGIAQIMQGFSTTGGASWINQSGGIGANSDFGLIATASRFAGARPMDEALLLDTKYRLNAYKASDKSRVESLGEIVKVKIRDGSLTGEDVQDFQTRYAQVGGRVENYGAALQRWTRDASSSVVNAVAKHNNSSYAQYMNVIMGADSRLANQNPFDTADD